MNLLLWRDCPESQAGLHIFKWYNEEQKANDHSKPEKSEQSKSVVRKWLVSSVSLSVVWVSTY